MPAAPSLDLAAMLARLLGGETTVFDAVLQEAGTEAPRILVDPSPEDIDGARLNSLFRYWLALPRGERLPLTRAIDPVEIGPALGLVMLLEPMDDPFEFRYRLYGTEVADASRLELTGKTTAVVPSPEIRAFFQVTYAAAVAVGKPLCCRHRPPLDYDVQRWIRLILPCEDGTGRIDRLLVGNEPTLAR